MIPTTKGYKPRYLVKWEDYDEKTWEPPSSFSDGDTIIAYKLKNLPIRKITRSSYEQGLTWLKIHWDVKHGSLWDWVCRDDLDSLVHAKTLKAFPDLSKPARPSPEPARGGPPRSQHRAARNAKRPQSTHESDPPSPLPGAAASHKPNERNRITPSGSTPTINYHAGSLYAHPPEMEGAAFIESMGPKADYPEPSASDGPEDRRY